jgi:hypothetical protein
MTRTTLDLDPQVLRQLRERQKREHRTLGQLASELLAQAMADDRDDSTAPPLDWPEQAMGALVDISDKDALRRVLDEDLSA